MSRPGWDSVASRFTSTGCVAGMAGTSACVCACDAATAQHTTRKPEAQLNTQLASPSRMLCDVGHPETVAGSHQLARAAAAHTHLVRCQLLLGLLQAQLPARHGSEGVDQGVCAADGGKRLLQADLLEAHVLVGPDLRFVGVHQSPPTAATVSGRRPACVQGMHIAHGRVRCARKAHPPARSSTAPSTRWWRGTRIRPVRARPPSG
jgi:hypothetical protein